MMLIKTHIAGNTLHRCDLAANMTYKNTIFGRKVKYNRGIQPDIAYGFLE